MLVTISDGDTWHIPLVDFHTHIGKVKIETTKGVSQRVNRPQEIVELYEKLQYEIYKRITTNSDNYYITLPTDVQDLAQPLYPVIKGLLEQQGNKMLRGWMIDHLITFPFNDIFHRQTEPKFVKSNQYVRHQTQSFDFSFRFIPFCRVDVTDKGAREEVIKSISLGMRGLKLHPLSQGWIEKIKSVECKEILKTAGELGIPVIFDVPNKGVAVDITTIAEETRKEVEFPINTVLGHSGFDYSSKEIFECLSIPGMYAETSGMRGKDVEIYFRNILENNVPDWEKKILFGTDSNYFGVLQAADFITYLFSFNFKDLLEKHDQTINPLSIASNILGLNALNVIPPIWSFGQNKVKIKGFRTETDLFYSELKNFVSKRDYYASIDFFSEKSNLVPTITLGRNNRIVNLQIACKGKDSLFLIPNDIPQERESLNSIKGSIEVPKTKKKISVFRKLQKFSCDNLIELFAENGNSS